FTRPRVRVPSPVAPDANLSANAALDRLDANQLPAVDKSASLDAGGTGDAGTSALFSDDGVVSGRGGSAAAVARPPSLPRHLRRAGRDRYLAGYGLVHACGRSDARAPARRRVLR